MLNRPYWIIIRCTLEALNGERSSFESRAVVDKVSRNDLFQYLDLWKSRLSFLTIILFFLLHYFLFPSNEKIIISSTTPSPSSSSTATSTDRSPSYTPQKSVPISSSSSSYSSYPTSSSSPSSSSPSVPEPSYSSTKSSNVDPSDSKNIPSPSSPSSSYSMNKRQEQTNEDETPPHRPYALIWNFLMWCAIALFIFLAVFLSFDAIFNQPARY